jgi:hypothetical protein
MNIAFKKKITVGKARLIGGEITLSLQLDITAINDVQQVKR